MFAALLKDFHDKETDNYQVYRTDPWIFLLPLVGPSSFKFVRFHHWQRKTPLGGSPAGWCSSPGRDKSRPRSHWLSFRCQFGHKKD